MKRIPLDPPWLVLLVIGGFVLGVVGDSIGFIYLGVFFSIMAAIVGYDRWYERNRAPRRR